MNLPKFLQNVVDSFEMLPGVGPKSAQRLAFYLLRVPKDDVLKFADALRALKENAFICKNCYNVADSDICNICESERKDSGMVCIVETPMDLLAIEKSGYKGLYHVLHGVINPMAGVGADEIFIPQLLARLKNDPSLKEVILATGTSLEGETTATYIYREIKSKLENIKVSRIGRGLPVGADLEYADEGTINDAFSNRIIYS